MEPLEPQESSKPLIMYAIHWRVVDAESFELLQEFDAIGRLFPTEKMALDQAAEGWTELNRDPFMRFYPSVRPIEPPIVEPQRRRSA